MTRKQKPNAGFTIIEVLIVLAIAGLILMLIFVAVPAMQRNARNNQRKHDVAIIDTARQEYNVTNGTAMIAGSGNCTPDYTGGFSGLCGYIKNLSFYRPEDVTFINNANTPPTTLPVAAENTVISSTYLVCNNNLPTTTGATPITVAIVYAIEDSGGGIIQKCADSRVVPLG